MKLRDYQTKGIRQVFEAWDPNRGNQKRVLFQMPTGTGKTVVFSEIVRKADVKGKRVLIVVHRKELVEQIVDKLNGKFGIGTGIIASGITSDESQRIQVATIQTLANRDFPEAEIVIIDECHHSKAEIYKRLWKHYPDSWFLGVTATPTRLNGEGFEDQYDTLISLERLSYFFDNGHLAKVKHLVCGIPDLEGVKKTRGDYNIRTLSNVMLQNDLMADLVKSWMKYAKGKKTIVFAVDIEHSLEIVDRFRAVEIPSEHIDANTPKKTRERILDSFRKGEILILSNVDIVSEGFDVPDCEAVQLARPTKSLVLYLQQVGRCMRPFEGKEHGLVLDNAGLWLEHGLSYIDREWSLEGHGKKKKANGTDNLVSVDEEGVIREISKPQEAEGLELVELTRELERLLVFESFVAIAIRNEHKPISAVLRFRDWLIEKKTEMTEVEAKYCSKRLLKLGVGYKKGYWYHLRKYIEDEIRAKAIVQNDEK